MAKQSGVLRYNGTIGGIRHYKIKGLQGDYAAFVNSVSGDRIKSAPEYERTRENMNEFSGCATISKAYRKSVAPLLKQMTDPHMTGRLIGVMKQVNLQDESEDRGYRAILVTISGSLLEGFPFNRNLSFDGFCTAAYEALPTEDKKSAEITVKSFLPKALLNAPGGTTHFRFINVLSLLSDYAYNELTKHYEPVIPALNEKSVIAYSDYLPFDKNLTGDISVKATFDESIDPQNESVACIQCIGIEFVQKTGAKYSLIKAGSAMMIAKVL